MIELVWSEELRSLKTSWNLSAISDYVADRPCAWIDDHIRDDVEEWALARDAPTLVLRANHRSGLTDDVVERALAFAAYASRAPRDEQRTGNHRTWNSERS